MKSKYSIGIFIAALILTAGVGFIFGTNYQHTKKEYLSGANLERSTHETVSATGLASKENGYFLTIEDGVVVVYHADKKTIYERTSIKASSLPKDLQNELQGFKKLSDLKALYGFLENYSS